jgi:hypothetical protein
MINYQLTYEKVTPTGKLFDQKFWLTCVQTIKQDIVQGIENQRQLDGSPYQRLKIDTIARKMGPHIIDHPGPKAIATSKMLTADERYFYKAKVFTKKVLKESQTRYISSQPSKRLIDGGNMQFTGTVRATEEYGEIKPGVQRVDVIYAQQEAPGPGNVATQFWGLSTKVIADITRLAKIRFDSWHSTKK